GSLASGPMALCARYAGRRAQHRGHRCPCHLLRTHPPAGALFDVVGGEDDELRSDNRCAGAIARRPALARRARLGRAAARRQPGVTVPLLMKVPRVAEGEDPAAIVSFEMEQMIVPRLAGPHVPGYFGTGDFDRQPYVVLERIPGKTLYSRIDELPLPYEEARVIGGQIATALADLHRQNVI